MQLGIVCQGLSAQDPMILNGEVGPQGPAFFHRFGVVGRVGGSSGGSGCGLRSPSPAFLAEPPLRMENETEKPALIRFAAKALVSPESLRPGLPPASSARRKPVAAASTTSSIDTGMCGSPVGFCLPGAVTLAVLQRMRNGSPKLDTARAPHDSCEAGAMTEIDHENSR
jgi:hypothetical protein